MMKKLLSVTILIAIIMFGFNLESQTQAATTHIFQDVTAYVGSTNGHGGAVYPNKAYSTVAVHQKSYTNSAPILDFGTMIITDTSLSLPGYGPRSIFNVTDTGDLNRRWSTYWIDIYFGTNTTTNWNNAVQFGLQNVSYTAY